MKVELHPLTAWLALCAVAPAIVSSDSAVLALVVVGGVAFIVFKRQNSAPWSRSFWLSIKFAFFLLVFRAFVGIVIAVPSIGRTLFTLPRLSLPHWMPGIRLGGPVTSERLFSSVHEGLIISTVIVLFGAANSLTSPHRLLRIAPTHIYEVAVTLVIGTSLFPQLAQSAARIRAAQEMRGGKKPSIRTIALPLLEESLARSLKLAESMESRGFGASKGRSRYRPIAWRKIDSAVLAISLCIATGIAFA